MHPGSALTVLLPKKKNRAERSVHFVGKLLQMFVSFCLLEEGKIQTSLTKLLLRECQINNVTRFDQFFL
jgi:hypothetical protein